HSLYIHVCTISSLNLLRDFLYLHSFPTRRSSDLAVWQDIDRLLDIDLGSMRIVKDTESGVFDGSTGEVIKATSFNVGSYTDLDRSEEHTSELQSRFDLVCRLLLEKKNIMK